ncbi:probable serine/threonine-protein kinase pats1, partial [Anneissia japonica]|uniref:probable serine/threonine-protein kinase pats1 n=1 Tax=Anneissia japonica TaxID=1529436 RepID=UPI001425B78E
EQSQTLGPTGGQKRKKSNDEVSGNEETNDGTPQATASASLVEDIAQSQRMDDVIKKVVQVMQGKSLRDNSLRIWDYGGQLIYHSIHRFYMTPEGIFLIVFNIADDLDAYAMVIDSSGKVHKHYMTNLEYLLYWIRSAYTYAKDDGRYIDNEIDFSVCIIVATHRNSLIGSEEEICTQIEEKFAKIRKAIENQVYKSHVYPKYFAVENKLSSSDGNIIELKKVILEMKEKFNRPIPHKWLDLLIAIQELSEGRVTLLLEQSTDFKKTNFIGRIDVRVALHSELYSAPWSTGFVTTTV